MSIYLISGLGADHHMFQNLVLPPGITCSHLNWIDPLPNESLSAYCQRLASSIPPDEDMLFIGLSFGGIVAIELAERFNCTNVIIISSVATQRELPWYFRLTGKLHLYRFISPTIFRYAAPLLYRAFGTRTAKERRMLKDAVQNSSPLFMKWAVKQILTWKRTRRRKGLFHIHGAKDRVLPFRNTHPDVCIAGGGHLMVLNESMVLNDELAQYFARNLSFGME